MIDSEKAIEKKLMLFESLKITNKQSADFGCGSGIDSIALSKLNNKVDAFDPSSKMLELAKKNSVSANPIINFYNHSIEDIPQKFNNKYEFICSLGNTIANVEPENLRKVFIRIKESLKPNGKIIIQILNYNLILSQKERVISIDNCDDNQFVRFYDFQDNHLVFNILQFSREDSQNYNLISTNLYPYKYETIRKIVEEVVFRQSKYYGNFNFDEFQADKSKDLIIILTK